MSPRVPWLGRTAAVRFALDRLERDAGACAPLLDAHTAIASLTANPLSRFDASPDLDAALRSSVVRLGEPIADVSTGSARVPRSSTRAESHSIGRSTIAPARGVSHAELGSAVAVRTSVPACEVRRVAPLDRSPIARRASRGTTAASSVSTARALSGALPPATGAAIREPALAELAVRVPGGLTALRAPLATGQDPTSPVISAETHGNSLRVVPVGSPVAHGSSFAVAGAGSSRTSSAWSASSTPRSSRAWGAAATEEQPSLSVPSEAAPTSLAALANWWEGRGPAPGSQSAAAPPSPSPSPSHVLEQAVAPELPVGSRNKVLAIPAHGDGRAQASYHGSSVESFPLDTLAGAVERVLVGELRRHGIPMEES